MPGGGRSTHQINHSRNMAWRTWGRCLSRCEIYAGSMIIKGGTLLLASSRFTEMRAEWKRLLRPLDRPVLYETSFRNRWKIWKKSQWSIILSSVAIMQLRVCARMHPFLYTKRRNKRRILLRSKFKKKRTFPIQPMHKPNSALLRRRCCQWKKKEKTNPVFKEMLAQHREIIAICSVQYPPKKWKWRMKNEKKGEEGT